MEFTVASTDGIDGVPRTASMSARRLQQQPHTTSSSDPARQATRGDQERRDGRATSCSARPGMLDAMRKKAGCRESQITASSRSQVCRQERGISGSRQEDCRWRRWSFLDGGWTEEMSVEIEVEVEVETVVVTGDDYLTATADRPEVEPRCVTDHVRRCLVLMPYRLIALSPYRLIALSPYRCISSSLVACSLAVPPCQSKGTSDSRRGA
jgi:hypothetical protein